MLESFLYHDISICHVFEVKDRIRSEFLVNMMLVTNENALKYIRPCLFAEIGY